MVVAKVAESAEVSLIWNMMPPCWQAKSFRIVVSAPVPRAYVKRVIRLL